ncbi:D-2-hydroxyacid dehydrogenase family protein [Actinopolymorpha rutila]|uniref:Phosphoglycerate dehydrogenase-like enzyme n=1 Tax=Actinopolymorpha rutila TaxID=446787 RepID=A0A852ZJ02_9ACTN|nr:D-2-hydroxyacid dehydrogenase family protein [Actinopolymorpha rutila]NYH88306.1 phosphoglycerate dehydrogenase-like enzyme [Actinopolymorpha rutila]
MTLVAVLDDYQAVAERMADWRSLPDRTSVAFFHDHLPDEDTVVERLAHYEVIVAMRERTAFTRSVLERLPRLRLLVTTGMRNAAIDLEAADENGVVVSGTPGSGGATTELAWALILGLVRHVPEEDAAVRAGGWQRTVGTDLAGSTLGLLGLGQLGRAMVPVAQAFGMRVLAWSANLTPEAAGDAGAERVEKDELFARSDVLSVHLKLSDRTHGLVGADELALMRPTAYLVNTSRGPIVDEQALVAALEEGRLAGAGLDVYDQEPLPAGHPLLKAPRTILTPHIGFVTRRTYEEWYTAAVDAIAAYLDGRPVQVLTPAR